MALGSEKNECHEISEGITVSLKEVVYFLLGNFSASEIYMPTFRNTQFHLHKQLCMKMAIGRKKK